MHAPVPDMSMDVGRPRAKLTSSGLHRDVGIVVPYKSHSAMGITLSLLKPSAPVQLSKGLDSDAAQEETGLRNNASVDMFDGGRSQGEHRARLEKLTKERNEVLDRWADPKLLSLTSDEAALNSFLKKDFKYLFGQTGFDPPVPARNPVSVSMHNPRFAAALWAVNTEAYRRKNSLSRSQKEVIALSVSLANQCPHCAYIHTAMGPAAGKDVGMDQMQALYQTGDVDVAFPPSEEQDQFLHDLAKWALSARDGNLKNRSMPCKPDQVPEVLGTAMLFSMLNRIVDAFVSKSESGPMFPLPVRLMMQFRSLAPMVQRMMSAMMSWMMYEADSKIAAGSVLQEINEIMPIVETVGGSDVPTLPHELRWAASDPVIRPTFAFLAAEADLLARTYVPSTISPYTKFWVSSWDGGIPKGLSRRTWLEPAINRYLDIKARSKVEVEDADEDRGAVAMLRLMLVAVVASSTIDDDLISECQEYHGIRGTHAAVHWAAFLAAQRSCELAYTKPATAELFVP